MAANTNDGVMGRKRLAQLAKAKLPFNPVGGAEIAGKNLDRLQAGMKMFNWVDPRFVTQEQAQANAWTVGAQAKNVVVKVRGGEGVAFDDVLLFNAADVVGMPSLAAMLAMSESEIAEMQGRESDIDDELTIGPARAREVETDQDVPAGELGAGIDLDKVQPIGVSLRDSNAKLTKDAELAAAAVAPKVAPVGSEVKFGVMADYWQNGLHNAKGVALANEINKAIKDKGLEADKDAIARLLAVYPDSRRLGINVVTEARLLADIDLRANVAEPRTLLNGDLVRDKDGAYRPAAGGLAVVVDKGDSLSLKGKSAQGYQAAMELALAKGWTAIELKGKPAVLANAWLEAKMLGLDVVNYAPTEKDKAAFAERVAEESKLKATVEQAQPVEQSRSVEQAPEVVEVRPFFDEQGLTKTATVIASVTAPVARPAVQDNEPLYGERDTGMLKKGAIPMEPPPVVRTVGRAGDVVHSDVTTGGSIGTAAGAVKKVLKAELVDTISQTQWTGKLIEHGAAPFQHEAKGPASYFAVIENEGKRNTVWGVDLGRSLPATGAKVGDVVTLGRGDYAMEAGGKATWAAEILSRAVHVPGLASLAPKMDVVTAGLQVGTIIEIVGGFAKQQTGRDPVLDVKWHDLSKLKGPALELGKVAEIQYAGGVGKVKGQELERAGLER